MHPSVAQQHLLTVATVSICTAVLLAFTREALVSRSLPVSPPSLPPPPQPPSLLLGTGVKVRISTATVLAKVSAWVPPQPAPPPEEVPAPLPPRPRLPLILLSQAAGPPPPPSARGERKAIPWGELEFPNIEEDQASCLQMKGFLPSPFNNPTQCYSYEYYIRHRRLILAISSSSTTSLHFPRCPPSAQRPPITLAGPLVLAAWLQFAT